MVTPSVHGSRSFPTSSVCQEGLRLPKNSSVNQSTNVSGAPGKEKLLFSDRYTGCLIGILIEVYEIIPTSLGSISSPIYPKQPGTFFFFAQML